MELREITYEQAAKILKSIPPYFKKNEWAVYVRQALIAGEFRIGNIFYEIIAER
jgi:hypothetical protein